MSVRKDYVVDGERRSVVLTEIGGDQFQVTVGDRTHAVQAHRLPDGRISFRLDGQQYEACGVQAGMRTQVRLSGRTWTLDTHQGTEAAATAASGDVTAPMTGTVLSVHVAIGDSVDVGDLLVALSAMKMEHKLCATVAGVVTKLTATVGDTVDQGTTLALVEPEE